MIPTTTREMLDLPKQERSRYLAAIPLTRTYVFNAMEPDSIVHIRRTIVRNGGTYREVYRFPGVFWVATFRTTRGMNATTRELVKWMNDAVRESNALHGHISDEELAEMLLDETFAQTGDVPALRFEQDIAIYPDKPREIRVGFHPITGRIAA